MTAVFYRGDPLRDNLNRCRYSILGWIATRRFERHLRRCLDAAPGQLDERVEAVARFWRRLDKTYRMAALDRSPLARLWAPAYNRGFHSARTPDRAPELDARARRWLRLGARAITRPVAWSRMVNPPLVRGLRPRRPGPIATPARLLQLLTVYDRIADGPVNFLAAAVHGLWHPLNEAERARVRATDPRMRIWELGYRAGQRNWHSWWDDNLETGAPTVGGVA